MVRIVLFMYAIHAQCYSIFSDSFMSPIHHKGYSCVSDTLGDIINFISLWLIYYSRKHACFFKVL